MPFRWTSHTALLAGALLSCGATVGAQSAPLTATTADGVTIYGEAYFGGLGTDAPLVLLFHQGGSNGRGEYAPLVPWLNGAGFRAIAWDQRSGGSAHGSENRTVAALANDARAEFCDAFADLQAALDHVVSSGVAERVVVWGSSYSGALVFRLAAENPERVEGVIAFSPASGGPMAECRARTWLDRVGAPKAVFRPRSEMERSTSIEQRDAFVAAAVEFSVVEDGVHGTSMLVDDRTGSDMSGARADVMRWLNEVVGRPVRPGGPGTAR